MEGRRAGGRAALLGGALALVLAGVARADSLRAPYTYTRPSPGGRYLFVMLGRDGTGEGPAYPASGLYRNDGSLEPLWTVDWYAYGVRVADDGEHLVREGHWVSGLDDEAVGFFARDRLLRSWTLRDLLGDRPPRPRTASFATLRGVSAFDGELLTYTLGTAAGDAFTFDLRTGELVQRAKGPRSGGLQEGPERPAPAAVGGEPAAGALGLDGPRRVRLPLVREGLLWRYAGEVDGEQLSGPLRPDPADKALGSTEVLVGTLVWEGEPGFGIEDVRFHDGEGKLVGATLHGEPGATARRFTLRPATVLDDVQQVRAVVRCAPAAAPTEPGLSLAGELPLARRELAVRGLPVVLERAAWIVTAEQRVALQVDLLVPAGQEDGVEVRCPGLEPQARLVLPRGDRRLVATAFGGGWLAERGLEERAPVTLETALPLAEPIRTEVHGVAVTVRTATLADAGKLTVLVESREGGLEVTARGWDPASQSTTSGPAGVRQYIRFSPGAGADRTRVTIDLQRPGFEPPADVRQQTIEVFVRPTRLYRLEGIALPR